MMDVGGQDATEAFEDVGHSDEAREILEGLLIGTLERKVCAILATTSLATADKLLLSLAIHTPPTRRGHPSHR